MWLGLFLVPVAVVWGLLAIVVCVVAGRVSRMEEMEQYVDSTAARLLEGIEIDL